MKSIEDSTLIDYILGHCDEQQCKIIGEMLDSSQVLRDRLANLRAVLADETPLLKINGAFPDALDKRILKTLKAPLLFEGFIKRLVSFLDLPEDQVRTTLAILQQGEEAFAQEVFEGIFLHPITAGPRHQSQDCSLVFMRPGAQFPKHRHNGDEWGFVLQGEAMEDNGHVAKPGDITYQSRHDQHSFKAIGDTPCIFVAIDNGISWVS